MNHPTDKELDEYLSRRSALSEQYRELDADDVSPELDAAVLAKAREAIQATPQSLAKRRPAWVRWSAPLALAASAVLVVAIVLEVGVREQVRLPAARVEQGPIANEAAKREVAPAELEEKVVEDVIDRPIDSLPSPSPAAAPFAHAPAPPPVVHEPGAVDASKPMQAAPDEQKRLLANQAASGAVRAQEAPATSALRKEAAAAASAASESRSESDQIVVTAQRREEAVQDVPITVTSINESSERRQAYGPRAPVASPRAAASKSTADSSLAAAPSYPTPEAWLEAIRKLRVDGKDADADELWRRFVAAYPNFDVAATDTARPKR